MASRLERDCRGSHSGRLWTKPESRNLFRKAHSCPPGGAVPPPPAKRPWSLLSTPSWRRARGPGRGTCGLCLLTASVGVLPRGLRALGQLRIFSDLNWPSHKTGRKGNRAPRSDAASPRVPWPCRAAGPGDPGAKGSHLRSHSHPHTHTHTHTRSHSGARSCPSLWRCRSRAGSGLPPCLEEGPLAQM